MYENAQEIFDFLPIHRDPIENEYIEYLWNSFFELSESDSSARSFVMMPFHLLFMLTLQYKVLRIFKEQKDRYDLALTIKNPNSGEEEVLQPSSPLALGFLGENEVLDLCKVLGFTRDEIKDFKKLVRYRNNNLAHAKGFIEQKPEVKIEEYLEVLRRIQPRCTPYNDVISSKWEGEYNRQDDLNEFIEARLLKSCLCPADFRSGELLLNFPRS